MADWSMLHIDLLEIIALKLDSAEDVIFFSSVCHPWYQAYSRVKKTWTAKMPWLMLPENTTENPTCLRKLLCLGNKKCYQIKLPETFGARCWGTASGWVVTLDLNLEIHLFNPFTRIQIRLPPQSAIPNQPKSTDNECVRACCLDKVFVFNGDGYEDDIVVMALNAYNYGGLIYARPSDEAWTSIVIRENHEPIIVDVLCLGSQLLILYNDGAIRCCDMGNIQNPHPVIIMQYLPPLSEEILGPLGREFNVLYLLDSFGDLVMIHRYKEIIAYWIDHADWDENVCYQTTAFEVCKLNPTTKSWKKVKDLGDVALFVGNNCSMSLQASITKNCKHNCIYFTDDLWEFWSSPACKGGHDMGIFHMEDNQIERIYEGADIYSDFCSALWFLPQFF